MLSRRQYGGLTAERVQWEQEQLQKIHQETQEDHRVIDEVIAKIEGKMAGSGVGAKAD